MNEPNNTEEDDSRQIDAVVYGQTGIDELKEKYGVPVAVVEAVFTAYAKKTVKGEDMAFISFLLPNDGSADEIARQKLGTIFKLYITREDIGI